MVRVSLFVCLFMGSLLILMGMYIVQQQLNEGIPLVNAGVGLISVSGVVKVFQANVEHRK